MERIGMEEKFDRELEAILKIIKLTQEGLIKWNSAKPWGDLVENEATRYVNVFYCDFEGKRLRIFTEKNLIDKPLGYPAHLEEMTRMAQGFLSGNKTYPYWKDNLFLEITNPNGQSLWRFPYKSATIDLLNAVKYSAAGVKDFLDILISKAD
jgi:hypothetical protein